MSARHPRWYVMGDHGPDKGHEDRNEAEGIAEAMRQRREPDRRDRR